LQWRLPCYRTACGAAGAGLYDLWERSPLRFDDDADHCEETIDGCEAGIFSSSTSHKTFILFVLELLRFVRFSPDLEQLILR
jgi:hypothetical protein